MPPGHSLCVSVRSPLSALALACVCLSASACRNDHRSRRVPHDTSEASAVIVRAPPPEPPILVEDLLEIHDLLESEDFQRLGARLAWHLDSALADPGYEHRYRTAFTTFTVPDSSLRPHLDAWIARAPASG